MIALADERLAAAEDSGARTTSFRHRRSSLVARGRPAHSSNDVLVNPKFDTVIEGKFAYGRVSKDLEDEDVSLWMIERRRWRRIATTRTDRDGRARFTVASSRLARAGAVPYMMIVDGDRTRTRGTIWVLQPKGKVVLFDIDGTLTAGGFVRKHLWGRQVMPRPNAAALTRRWVAAGYLPVYLTARPYLYTAYSRGWLTQHGFAEGAVIHSDSLGDGMPGRRGAGAFKTGYLQQLVRATQILVGAAYGDQDSDACAFAEAGIDPAITFIWGDQSRSCNGNGTARAISDYGNTHVLPVSVE